MSVEHLAAALGAAKGTVGYHMRILLEAGLVRIAHARTVRGGTEQYFEPTAPALRIAPQAPGAGGGPRRGAGAVGPGGFGPRNGGGLRTFVEPLLRRYSAPSRRMRHEPRISPETRSLEVR
ncbi:hypothetical protein GCM10022255_070980 [Dactylosporangium darangshiense]|uniref:HTH arsR-type domain-containing protein n=1 Tax=Dactylosporangium darangshiense TaxID=579108 RepID=A0ABP8DIG7_9ACTN